MHFAICRSIQHHFLQRVAEREGDKGSQDHKTLLTVYYPLYFGFIGVLLFCTTSFLFNVQALQTRSLSDFVEFTRTSACSRHFEKMGPLFHRNIVSPF